MSSLDQNSVPNEINKINEMVNSFMQKTINKLVLINEENEVEISILEEELAILKNKLSIKDNTSGDLLSLVKGLEKKIDELTKENKDLNEKLSESYVQKRLSILEEKVKQQPYIPYNPNQNPLTPFIIPNPYSPPYTVTCSNLGRGDNITTTGFIQPVGTKLPDSKIVTTTVNNGKVTTSEWNGFSDTFKDKSEAKEQCCKTEGCVNVAVECTCDHEEDAVCSKGCGYQNPVESKVQKLSKKEFLSCIEKIDAFIEDARINKTVNKDKLPEESKLIRDLISAIENEANKKLKEEHFKTKISNINDEFIKETVLSYEESEHKEKEEYESLKRQKIQELGKEVQFLVNNYLATSKSILHG